MEKLTLPVQIYKKEYARLNTYLPSNYTLNYIKLSETTKNIDTVRITCRIDGKIYNITNNMLEFNNFEIEDNYLNFPTYKFCNKPIKNITIYIHYNYQKHEVSDKKPLIIFEFEKLLTLPDFLKLFRVIYLETIPVYKHYFNNRSDKIIMKSEEDYSIIIETSKNHKILNYKKGTNILEMPDMITIKSTKKIKVLIYILS